ncbi:ribonuclease H-like domain-containing protein [Irpex lacteus]|nr:ribonuclease H-like domain-containing protein [Irpex lacteus]
MRLICLHGLVPNILDSPEWKELMGILNPNYKCTPANKFSGEYIPKEAVFVREEQLKELRQQKNLTVTRDGGNTRRDSIYFVHITTSDREHYFLDGHVGTKDHHTSAWVEGRLMKSIEDVGIDRTAGACTDDCAQMHKVRGDIHDKHPTICNLRDCCHLIHGIVEKTSKLSEFDKPLARMKKIVAHFSKSTFSKAMLKLSVEDGEKLYALQKIGKTRFGTYWSSAQTVLPALPKIRKLVQDKEIKFKVHLFEVRVMPLEYHKLELALSQYVVIIAPLIRSLWSLEASTANASDVFVFFTAIAAQLRDLFQKSPRETGIPTELANSVIEIFNDKYDNMFLNNDIYFVAFALDPRRFRSSLVRYPISDYLLIPPTANPSITVPHPGIDLTMPYPRAYDRVKEYTKDLLKAMIAYQQQHSESNVEPLLKSLTLKELSIELKRQLEAFWRGQYPFNRPLTSSMDSLAWWFQFQKHPDARVLAMLSIRTFFILVNSMPDERTASKFTWLNSSLRGNQNAQTLIDMIQVGQYYARKVCYSTSKG